MTTDTINEIMAISTMEEIKLQYKLEESRVGERKASIQANTQKRKEKIKKDAERSRLKTVKKEIDKIMHITYEIEKKRKISALERFQSESCKIFLMVFDINPGFMHSLSEYDFEFIVSVIIGIRPHLAILYKNEIKELLKVWPSLEEIKPDLMTLVKESMFKEIEKIYLLNQKEKLNNETERMRRMRQENDEDFEDFYEDGD